MKMKNLVASCVVTSGCLGILLPATAIAQTSAVPPGAHSTMDVSLHQEGLLVGQVVNRQGQAKDGSVVSLRQSGRELVRMRTDRTGRFAVKGLRGGVYELATSGTSRQVRVWPGNTAPPSAVHSAMLVEGTIVRGQEPQAAGSAYDGTVYGEGDPYAPADGTTYYGNGSGYYGGQPASGGGIFGGGGWFRNGRVLGMRPWVLGAGIATAIAVPIALDDNDAS